MSGYRITTEKTLPETTNLSPSARDERRKALLDLRYGMVARQLLTLILEGPMSTETDFYNAIHAIIRSLDQFAEVAYSLNSLAFDLDCHERSLTIDNNRLRERIEQLQNAEDADDAS